MGCSETQSERQNDRKEEKVSVNEFNSSIMVSSECTALAFARSMEKWKVCILHKGINGIVRPF